MRRSVAVTAWSGAAGPPSVRKDAFFKMSEAFWDDEASFAVDEDDIDG